MTGVDPVSIITGFLGNLFSENTVKELVENGVVKELVAKMQPETASVICITILGYNGDSGDRSRAIQALRDIAVGKVQVVSDPPM
jgi:hypothetical protein